MTPKKTCKSLGIESVAELTQAVGKPTRTVSHWFNSEPALFTAVLLGVAVKKVAGEIKCLNPFSSRETFKRK